MCTGFGILIIIIFMVISNTITRDSKILEKVKRRLKVDHEIGKQMVFNLAIESSQQF